MTLEYRMVDEEAVEGSILAERARAAEDAAYAAEVEHEKLVELSKATGRTEESRKALKEQVDRAAENVASLRARANRLNEGTLNPAEVTEIHRAYLQRSLQSLESEHVSHKSLHSQRQRSLDTKGKNALKDEEKVDVEARMKDNEKSMSTVETSWHVVTKRLDALPATE